MPLLPLSNPVGASIAGIAGGGGAANTVLERTRNKTAREIIASIALSLPGVCRVAKRRLRRLAIIRRDGHPPALNSSLRGPSPAVGRRSAAVSGPHAGNRRPGNANRDIAGTSPGAQAAAPWAAARVADRQSARRWLQQRST